MGPELTTKWISSTGQGLHEPPVDVPDEDQRIHAGLSSDDQTNEKEVLEGRPNTLITAPTCDLACGLAARLVVVLGSLTAECITTMRMGAELVFEEPTHCPHRP